MTTTSTTSSDYTVAMGSLLNLDEMIHENDDVLDISEAPAVKGRRSSASLSADAQQALIIDHLAMVRYVARKVQSTLPAHIDLEDLIAAGTLGLVDAAAKFDARTGVQFGSYAQFRVRGAILDSLRDLDWGPRELRRKGRSVEQAIASATRRLGRTASEAEIAAEMQLALSDYQALLGELSGLEIGSLNLEHGEESGEEEIAYIADAPEEQPLFQCLRGEMKQHLIDAIDALPERERMVVTLYYYEELTMKEIGEVLGVVESRVSQLRSSAVARLRSSMSELASETGRKTGRQARATRKNAA